MIFFPTRTAKEICRGGLTKENVFFGLLCIMQSFECLIRRPRRLSKLGAPCSCHTRLFSICCKKNDVDNILQQTGMSKDTKAHVNACSGHLGCPALGVGLWADGVPCNWDRSHSLECVSMFFPGWADTFRQVRIPLLVIQKRFVCQQGTFDDVCEVLKYSFDCLATGVLPKTRHAGEAWHATDSKRKHWGGKPIGIQGVLCEIRGDWQMYSTIFRLGSWSGNKNCCWKCTADKAGIKQFGLEASWRTQRLNHIDFLVRLHQLGLNANPLFDCPFFL